LQFAIEMTEITTGATSEWTPVHWPEPRFDPEWVKGVAERYQVSRDLRVRRTIDGAVLQASKTGRICLTFKQVHKTVMVTKLALTSFDPKGTMEKTKGFFYKSEWHADHVVNRGQSGAHHLNNLQWLHITEHSRKTNGETKTTRKSNALARSKAIRIVSGPDRVNEEFPSIREASRQMGLDHGRISLSCRNAWKVKGYVFAYIDQPDLAGEKWKFDELYGIHGSNFGRIKTKRGVKTYGCQYVYNGVLSKYSLFNTNGKHVPVHDIIARLFIGPRPSGMVVCHQDSDEACVNGRYRNWAIDLRYGTQSENMKEHHASKKRKIE
jgi:hypothetical protein